MTSDTRRSVDEPIIELLDVHKRYQLRSPLGTLAAEVNAVNGVSFSVRRGECYGLVGESGCGKSTVGRLVQNLIPPTSGEIRFDGKPVSSMARSRRRSSSAVQMIFQDPYSSLNPRKRVGAILAESLRIAGLRDRKEIRARVVDSLEAVGFSQEHADRFPHEFSGGQRQRIGIARALSVDPEVILCDEPVSALDVSIQSQILNLLRRLQRERGFAYIFISHDLSVVRYIADRVGVMYLGKLVEEGPTQEVFDSPRHPYTKALLAAVPVRRPRDRRERQLLRGDVPSPIDLPSGCVFRTRCPQAMEVCASVEPLPTVTGARSVACHLHPQPSLLPTRETA